MIYFFCIRKNQKRLEAGNPRGPERFSLRPSHFQALFLLKRRHIMEIRTGMGNIIQNTGNPCKPATPEATGSTNRARGIQGGIGEIRALTRN